jgi:hypothetical protein
MALKNNFRKNDFRKNGFRKMTRKMTLEKMTLDKITVYIMIVDKTNVVRLFIYLFLLFVLLGSLTFVILKVVWINLKMDFDILSRALKELDTFSSKLYWQFLNNHYRFIYSALSMQ